MLIGSALYGCGSSGSANSAGSSGNSGTGVGAPTSATPTLSGQKGNVIVTHTLATSARKRTQKASAQQPTVSTDAVQFVYTGFDGRGNVLYGPITRPRQQRQLLADVPVEVTRIHVDYNNSAGQHIAFADIVVQVIAGRTVIVGAIASDAFTVELTNDTGAPDSQVYVLVAANPPPTGGTQIVSGVALVNTASNTFTPTSNKEATGHGTLLTNLTPVGTVASKTRPHAFNTVYAFTIENLVSGRVYLTYGNNALFTLGGTNNSVFQAPSADANFRWDVMELTVPAATPYPICYTDLTSIQFLGMPLQLESFADSDGQQGLAWRATNSPAAGSNVSITGIVTDGIVAGNSVVVGDAANSEVATVATVGASSITVNKLVNSYTTPYVTLVADSALQTRTFHASTPTILNAIYALTTATDNRMQWAFQSLGTSPAPPPAVSPTPVPSCSPGGSPSPTPAASPGPNVAVRGYQSGNTWLAPANVGAANSFLRVQGPQTTVSEPWAPASPSPNPSLIVGNNPNSYVTQRPYRAYPYPTFAGYVGSMVGSCYHFAGANSCGGTATQWNYGGTVSGVGSSFLMTLNPLSAMSPNSTLGCGPGSSSGVNLPTDLPVSVALIPNDQRSQSGDLDFIVYSTPGGVFQVSVPCNLVSSLDNSVYANIADDALAGLQFGYINGIVSPNDGTVWFAGFPSFPPFGAARSTSLTTNDGLYNPYAAIIYNYSDAYGFPYSDRIAEFNPLLTTTNSGSTASSTLRITLLNDLRPDAPANISITSGAGGTSAVVNWSPATKNANDPTQATSYTVTISDGLPSFPTPSSADLQTQTVSGTTCTFSGLHPGTTYVAYIVASYPDGTISTRSGLANVLTAGTPTFAPGGTSATFNMTMAWDGGNLSQASQFTLNVAGQAPQTLSNTTPVTIPVTGTVGTNFIPFTITTTNTNYPSSVPPLPGSKATVVDSGAFVVILDPASATTFTVNTAYMTDGSPLIIPPGSAPYADNGAAPQLSLSATLAPGQTSAAGSGVSNNVIKVVRPVFYPAASPSPPNPTYSCPSTGYTPPAPSATPCPPLTFVPSQGLPGSTVQITMFINGNLSAVLFNGVPSTSVSASPLPSPNQLSVITATVPYNSTASGLVEVDTDQGKTVSLTPFTLQQPTFTLSPTSANVGDVLTLTAQGGFNFLLASQAATPASATVQYGSGCNTAADPSPTVSPSTITTSVPVAVQAGKNTMTVVFPNGITATGPAVTVLNPMFTITPTSGFPGSTVTLTPLPGSSLADVTNVTFTGSVTNVFTSVVNGSITVTVPTGATTGFVTVTDGQNVTGTSQTPFTVNLPTFTVSPTSAGYGTTLTLTASTTGGLQPLPGGSLTASFGGPTSPILTLDNTNTIATVAVPNGANSGNITITGALAGTLTSSTSFTVTHPAIAAVNPFNPASGQVGSTVVITGTSLNSATNVFFTSGGGTVPAVTFTTTPTTITATVPVGATTGVVQATDATGQGTASTVQFTVLP